MEEKTKLFFIGLTIGLICGFMIGATIILKTTG